MKIYRGGRTSKTWNKTDAVSITLEDWHQDRIIKADGTIKKNGQRHTNFGVEIESNDIV